jgi:hypothetical protein
MRRIAPAAFPFVVGALWVVIMRGRREWTEGVRVREGGSRAPSARDAILTRFNESLTPAERYAMLFLSIIKAADQGPPPQALLAAMTQLTEESLKDGSLVQTGGLSASSTGARVRLTGGKLTVTDGPYTEAKEMIGGYAMLELPSQEEAIAAAVRFLQLHTQHWPTWEGECEIRQLVFLAPSAGSLPAACDAVELRAPSVPLGDVAHPS